MWDSGASMDDCSSLFQNEYIVKPGWGWIHSFHSDCGDGLGWPHLGVDLRPGQKNKCHVFPARIVAMCDNEVRQAGASLRSVSTRIV